MIKDYEIEDLLKHIFKLPEEADFEQIVDALDYDYSISFETYKKILIDLMSYTPTLKSDLTGIHYHVLGIQHDGYFEALVQDECK